MRTLIKKISMVLLILLITVLAGFVGWASFPLGPGPDAQIALHSDTNVTIEKINNWTVFRPTDLKPDTGFIFYPGGRVDYRSYAPLLKPLAQQGYLVVLVPMPLSMAVFSPGKAEAVLPAFPEIRHWAIGGHSLGGAMAAQFSYNHPNLIQGLVLWASYPAGNNNLEGRNLAVLSIYGSHDGQVEKLTASSNLLPINTTWVIISGGNHAQFGDYGLQPGDGDAEISPQAQWDQVIAATSTLLQSVSE